MKDIYEISKEKGGRWYAHLAGKPNAPIAGSFGDKRFAMKFAAKSMGITVKEFMRSRKINSD